MIAMEQTIVVIKELKVILQNQRGVALMMIMTSIIFLMAIYGEFTFDSKISRIKATNILDRSQAKLLAESGLQLAMARLRLYKEAYNKIQSNSQAKDMVSAQLLNQLWEVPFIYPIPITSNAGASFKNTVEKFQEESLLDGEMKVSIQNISNRFNLNLLRMDMAKFNPDTIYIDANSAIDLGQTADRSTDVSIPQTIYNIVKINVDHKKEKDENFDSRASSINYQDMISNLKFYISDFQSLGQDPMSGEAESHFQSVPLTPKYGPLGSASELYSIPGWGDEIIELVQNEFTAHPSSQIDLNKITATMLKILIPTINTEEEVQEFFTYRDDPERPKFFNSTEDFKKYIVDIARLMNSANFDERIQLFQAKGVSFGPNPNFFKIVSEGTFNRSNYTLVAFVSLPIQESVTTAPNTNNTNTTNNSSDGNTDSNSTNTSTNTNNASTAKQSSQLLDPRVIEIQIN